MKQSNMGKNLGKVSIRSKALLIILAFYLFIFPAGSSEANYVFTSFDYPNTSGITLATGVNDAGQIVGAYYCGENYASCGFLRSDSTQFISFNYPNSSGVNFAFGINTPGEIVGVYRDNTGAFHGFLRSDSGTFIPIDYPSANKSYACGINDVGKIAGYYSDTGGGFHGFLRSDSTDFVSFDYPEANEFTQALGINNTDQIVGVYVDNSGTSHGFMRSGSGDFTPIDPPDSVFTYAQGINDAAQVVGHYIDNIEYRIHGFVRMDTTRFTPIDYPNALWTWAYGINNVGQIVGFYADSNWGFHGFLATPLRIDIKPGSDSNRISHKSQGKIPVAILSTKDFNALSQVDPTSLTFGRTGDEQSLAFCDGAVDVNGDGWQDLVCNFYTQSAGFQCFDSQGILKGKTIEGFPIDGSDSVEIMPCK